MSFNLHFITDYWESIVDLARDVDVLLLECSYPKHIKVDGHLNSTLAGRIAREPNCRKLILTHFYPICDDYDILEECREEFSGEIVLARGLNDYWGIALAKNAGIMYEGR